MSVKRSHAAMAEPTSDSPECPFLPIFETFRKEIDEHHERRERVIKASRDITASSKKIIFTLHRLRTIGQPLPDHITKANKPYTADITTKLTLIGPDLQGRNADRYARQISSGLQEYIEAASFQYYLETGTLLTYANASETVRSLCTGEAKVELGYEDYILGLYDFTGEVMKFGITAMATSGTIPISGPGRTLLTDLRALRAGLEGVRFGGSPVAREVEKKAEVMRVSVEKVEKALYGLTVRAGERPKGWMPSEGDGGRGEGVEV
nr:hypothetical protein B0A51_14425 [Rachicladosporium sp. CCFEE 5018]